MMKAFLIMIIGLSLLGCDKTSLMTDSEIIRAEKHSKRIYKETEEAVRYFTTCAEGYLFVVTGAGHGDVMAGPIGRCGQNEQ